jgi:uncharacterized protein (DUF362 family)/ferredoxin
MSFKSIVAIKKIDDYQPSLVLQAMRECLAPLGGMSAFVKPGQKVLLKPNLLGPFASAKAVTTHPAVVRAAILLAQEAGGTVYVGDSPGISSQLHVARSCGLMPVMEETRAAWANFQTEREYEVPQHLIASQLILAQAVQEADVIISLPKLKTHGQMTFTGALKNQYGLIPGMLKSQWHFRLQKPEYLARLILDIHRIAKPALAIMDGIMAMEGMGPSGGQPRKVGVLLASPDLVALDTIACQLIQLDPRFVPLLAEARKLRLGATSLDEINIAGEDWRVLQVPDFKKVSQLVDVLKVIPLPRSLLNWIRGQWTARPRIDPSKCVQCGICENGCPVSPAAIHPALLPSQAVNDEACIRCYCCHEFCPNHALELHFSLLKRTLQGNPMLGGPRKGLARFRSRRSKKEEPPSLPSSKNLPSSGDNSPRIGSSSDLT